LVLLLLIHFKHRAIYNSLNEFDHNTHTRLQNLFFEDFPVGKFFKNPHSTLDITVDISLDVSVELR
jgi:hypothetical protein